MILNTFQVLVDCTNNIIGGKKKLKKKELYGTNALPYSDRTVELLGISGTF